MWYCTLFVVIFVKVERSFCRQDYYWRDYTGIIPEDAVAGDAINSKNIFIGQAYIHNDGLIVSEIFPGKKEVQAPINGIRTVDTSIKILCGIQQNLYWAPANATHLHLTLINKRPVAGCHETGGILYIGRMSHEGNIKIGKVAAFNIQDAKLWFSHKGKEISAGSYEILLCNEENADVSLQTLCMPSS